MRKKWYSHLISPYCNGCALLAEIVLRKEGYVNVSFPIHSDLIIISGRFIGDEKEEVLGYISSASSERIVFLLGDCAIFSLEESVPFDHRVEGCPINIIKLSKMLKEV